MSAGVPRLLACKMRDAANAMERVETGLSSLRRYYQVATATCVEHTQRCRRSRWRRDWGIAPSLL